MTDTLMVLIGAILVNNLALTQLLGPEPLICASGNTATANALAKLTPFIMVVTTLCAWLCNHYLLVPLDLQFLRTLCYLVIVITVASLAGQLLPTLAPGWQRSLRPLLPLLTLNCVLMGVALHNDDSADSLLLALVYSLGAALGLSLALLLLSALRERVTVAEVPQPFQGASLALISAGVMALAFLGFAGLV